MSGKKAIDYFGEEIMVREMIKYEGELRRRVFYRMREAELQGWEAGFSGVEIQCALPSEFDLQSYELKDDLPGCKMFHANIIAYYQLRKKGKPLVKRMELINNRGGWGIGVKVLTTEAEHKAMLKKCTKVINEMAQLIYENWKVMNPTLNDYLAEQEREYRVTLWIHKGLFRFFSATSFEDVKELVGTDEGIVCVYSKKSHVQELAELTDLTDDEIAWLFRHETPIKKSLREGLAEELKHESLRQEIRAKYGKLIA